MEITAQPDGHAAPSTAFGRAAACALILFALAPLRSSADVTNEIDIAALSAFGGTASGETNGWYVSRVDSYAGDDNIRLSGKGNGYLLAPDFGSPVRRLVLKVKSSSQTDRRLAFVPWDGLMYDAAQAVYCPYSPNKDTYVACDLQIPDETSFSRFKIALIGDGATGWGIQQLAVVTAAAARPSPALAHLATNETGVILLSSCRRSRQVLFQPDFALLSDITNDTVLADGWFPPLFARAFSNDCRATKLSVNGSTTQYQGHYVWASEPVGLGSYTASSTDRSWRWRLANDTANPMMLDDLSAVFGQWGARNSLPDHLICEWEVSSPAGLPAEVQPRPVPSCDIYVSAYTNKAPNAQFPALERRKLSHPGVLRRGEILTLTFRDTCPDKGSNALLGLAGLRLLAHPVAGTIFLAR